MTRISVAMGIKNGASYIKEQLDSILPQLTVDDEIIISDDHSIDNSSALIKEYTDVPIKFTLNPSQGLVPNFENSLLACSGEFIFLCDQDDVWHPQKVSLMMEALQTTDLVVSDCSIANATLQTVHPSFFQLNNSGPGLLRNILRNSYMGCCMAFRRKILDRALPFPKRIPMHDVWIGLIGESFYKTRFINSNLVVHRRHNNNGSSTSEQSKHFVVERVWKRLHLIGNLIIRTYAK